MLVGMVVITVNKQGSDCQYYHLFHRVPHITLYVGSVKQISVLPKVTLDSWNQSLQMGSMRTSKLQQGFSETYRIVSSEDATQINRVDHVCKDKMWTFVSYINGHIPLDVVSSVRCHSLNSM